MSDHELLLALSDMMDTKLKPVNDRLEKVEESQERLEESYERLEESYEKLEQSFGKMEQSQERLEESYERLEESYERLEQSFEKMEQSQTKMQLTLENNILPRLQTIEGCYLSTFERYQSGIQQIEAIQSDVDVIKTTVTKHSEMFQKLA